MSSGDALKYVDYSVLLNELITNFLHGEKFWKIIDPIIIRKDNRGSFDPVELLNRLAYTIIDQQRDVSSVIIPIWVNMMFKNMNPEFLSKSPYATEFVQVMLQAYGHQNYHSKEDLKFRGRRGASRTEAFIQVYKKYSPDDFLEFILRNSHNLELIFKELIKLNFISYKGATFFLRDVEGLEYDILPIDVNVAYSFQYTGLFFMDENNPSAVLRFHEVLDEIIPISKRTEIFGYLKISDKICSVCERLGYNPHEINRCLFLLGTEFCQSLKCASCPINNFCYFNSLSDSQKKKFLEKIKLN